jgi:hypothetical protein
MSLYLAVAVELVSVEEIMSTVPERLFTEDASEMPIGTAARGKWQKAGCVLLMNGADSSHLFGVLRKKSADRRSEFRDCLRLLLDNYESDVAFVFHTFRGLVTNEKVVVAKDVRVHASKLDRLMDVLEEDVRYTVYQ